MPSPAVRLTVLAFSLSVLSACAGSGDPPVRTATPTVSSAPTATSTTLPAATATSTAPAATHTATIQPVTHTATLQPATHTATLQPATQTATLAPPTATGTPTGTATSTVSVTSTPTDATPPTATPTQTATDIPTLEPLAIRADGEWVRDAQGRVVILRGANYSGLEFGNFIGNQRGPKEENFAQMASWGFNVIRLPFAWSYLEPQPNQFSDAHLHDQVDPVIDFAARHGIAVIPELHQFYWSPCFTNGNGAPAWVCEGHNYTNDFAGALRAGCDFISGITAPDGRTLQDHFVDVWSMIGHHFAGDARVIGLNPINEPHSFGCTLDSATATANLYALYRRIRTAVQAQGAMQTLVIDPPVVRNLMIRVPTEPFGPDVLYAPHLYTQTVGLPELKYNGDKATVTADYDLATSEAEGFGGPLWVGEYGGNTNAADGFRAATELYMRHQLEEQDSRLIGGAAWAYFPSDNVFSVVDAEGNEKGDLVNILARPYARRIAGVPTEMRFDFDTKEFVFSWRVEGTAPGGGVSEVFVPARHYPPPFDFELSDGVAMQFDAESQILLLAAANAGEYTLRLRPAAP